MPKTSLIRPVVSIQYWLVTNGRTDRRIDGHMTTENTALADRRAVEKRVCHRPTAVSLTPWYTVRFMLALRNSIRTEVQLSWCAAVNNRPV